MKSFKVLWVVLVLFALGAAGQTHAQSEAPLPKALPDYGPQKALPFLKVHEHKLDNGLSVWVIPRDGVPRVDMALFVLGGTASDSSATPALSSMMAGLLNEGTKTRSSFEIAQQLQAIGGSYSASASADVVLVQASALAPYANKLLELVADTVMRPTFPENEVELAKRNATQTLMVQRTDPSWQAQTAFDHVIYGEHPYARDQLTDATIAAATQASLRALHEVRMRPDRALLVIVGRIDDQQVIAFSKQAFAGWKVPSFASTAAIEKVRITPQQRVVVQRDGAVQSNIRYGRVAVPMNHPDYVPLRVANSILGGGFTSRIMRDIREEKGYSYSPVSVLYGRRDGGSVSAIVDVRNEVTGATLDELGKIYSSMSTKAPSAEELTGAKRLEEGIYLLRNQIQSSLAKSLGQAWVNGLPSSFLARYVTESNAVTAKDVQAMGRKYFAPELQSVVIVGDSKAIEGQLQTHGTFSPYRP